MFVFFQGDDLVRLFEIVRRHLGGELGVSLGITNPHRFQGLDRRRSHRADIVDAPLQGQSLENARQGRPNLVATESKKTSANRLRK